MENADRPAPTHYCTTCGALWRFWPQRDIGRPDSWNQCSPVAGPCCDNVVMGEQIVPLTWAHVFRFVQAQVAVDAMLQQMFGPKPGDAIN